MRVLVNRRFVAQATFLAGVEPRHVLDHWPFLCPRCAIGKLPVQ